MSIISPCMAWVPILWDQLLGLFINNRAVIAFDDPPSDLLKVNDPLLDPLPVNNPLPHLPAADDPQSVHVGINNLFHHLVEVDGSFANSPAVDHPLLNLRAVDDNLPDLQAVDDSLPDFLAVDDPHLRAADGPLLHLPPVDDPLPNLPYHIIIDILSRLPAKCVFQCQRVPRLQYVLAASPSFTRTHLNRATSVMALQSISQSTDRDIKLYFIDEAENIEATTMKLELCYMLKHNPIMLYGSYDGLLLFRNKFSFDPVFIMWNPITKEQVTVTSPCSHLYVCGFYFHPLKLEYELLFLCKEGAKFEFQILSLGTKSWRNIGSCSYPPCCERPAIIINGALYWMVDRHLYYKANNVYPSCSHSIVLFKIETEEFSTMEVGNLPDRQMHLFEMEGQLCLSFLSAPLRNTELAVWVLNQTTKCWVERHVLALPMCHVPQYFSDYPNQLSVEVVHHKKGQVLVRQHERLFLCNLQLGSCRVIEKKGFDSDNIRATIHTHSLVSLHTDRFISLRRLPSGASK